jgi:hypothetical protein
MLIASACSTAPPEASEPAAEAGISSEPATEAKTAEETVAETKIAGEPVKENRLVAKSLEEDEGDLVCRYERTVGSRIGKRICRTEREIEAERQAGQETLEHNAFMRDKDRIVSQ